MLPFNSKNSLLRFLSVARNALLLILCCIFLYSCGANRKMRQEMLAENRDPLTNVIVGTEAVTLTPPPGKELKPSVCVLMIHGFLSARTDFSDLGHRLAERGYTVRLMRLPGHGTTPIEFAHLQDGALYRAVEREYLTLQGRFDRIYAVGFSMGGSLATLLAAHEGIDRLVLIAPYYAVTHKWYYILPAMTWNHLLGWIVPYMSRPTSFVKINDRANIGKYFMYRTLPTAGVRQLEKIGLEASRAETLSKIKCPVLLVHSSGDEASSPEGAQRAFDAFPSTDKQSMWVSRSNHVLLWDYDRDDVKRRIEMFLFAPYRQ